MNVDSILKTVLKFAPFAVLAVVGYFVYKKFFKKTLNEVATNATKEQGTEGLSNGLTYLQAASNLIDFMFSKGFAGSLFFNVNEKALGEFLLTICADEFRKLEQVYNQLKDSKLPTICLGRGGTLSDDLDRCFSKKEKAQYMSHLLIL